jgi:bifunctional DNase/RNase
MGKIKLKVLGLSYSQTQSGAYALVLAEEEGERRIPIIIGGFEAQAIAIELEGLRPPRPLTHDLFVNFASAFKIELLEVTIHKLEEGIFYSELICDNGGTRIKIDARTSDAVALAIRFGSPIYTTQDIMNKAGIILPVEDKIRTDKSSERKKTAQSAPANHPGKSVDQLKEMLQKLIEDEKYEEASKLRDEIKRREDE